MFNHFAIHPVIPRLVEVGITTDSLAVVEPLIGAFRLHRICVFVARQPAAIRETLFSRYVEREVQAVVDLEAEKAARLQQAIRTAKRNVVLSYNVGNPSNVTAYIQDGRKTRFGKVIGANLVGPLTIPTAMKMAERMAHRDSAR